MDIVYGVDPGVKNFAIVKLVASGNKFSIAAASLLDLSRSYDPLHKFYSQHMIDGGDVYIEQQFRPGATKNISNYARGYLTAMLGPSYRISMPQPVHKFNIVERLGIMPQDHGDLKRYANRKKAAEKVMNTIVGKIGESPCLENFSNNKKKMDDIADALIYALHALRDRCPESLEVISSNEIVSQMKPKEIERRIHITL